MSVKFDQDGFQEETGLRLAIRRKTAGLTQEDLAAKIGLKRACYANIESGRQRVPLDVVWRAALVLKCKITDVIPEPL